jgi:tetratricopeptide (TPR) repeat protein
VLRRQIHAVNRVCVIVLLLLCACVLGGCGRRIDLAAVLHEANAAYTQGDYARAAWLLHTLKQRRALQDSAALRISLGACYLKLGWLPYAGGEFSRAIEFDRTNALAWMGLGTVYAHTNDYRKAIDCYLHAQQFDPQNAALYRKLGNALFAIKEYAQAADHYLYAAQLGDENDDLFATVGYCYERTYQWQKAVNAYLKAYGLNRRNAYVVLRLAVLYRDQFNNMVQMKNYYDILRKINPQVAQAEARAFEDRLRTALVSNPLFATGGATNAAVRATGPTNAAARLTPELQQQQAVADHYEKLARRSILNDDAKKAIQYFSIAYSNEPARVHYLKEIAGLYEKSFQDLSMALKYYEQYLEKFKDKDDPEFDQMVVYVRGLHDRYVQQDAERQRRQAEEEQRAKDEAARRAQEEAERQKQFEQAKQSAETYDTLLDEGARYMRSESLDLERARQAYQKAITLDPKIPNAYYNLGLVYLRMTNFVQCVPYFEKALEQDATFADSHLALGMVYERQRDLPKAIEHYQLYLEVAPNGLHAATVRDWVTRHAGAQ